MAEAESEPKTPVSRRRFLKYGVTAAVAAAAIGVGGYYAYQAAVPPAPAKQKIKVGGTLPLTGFLAQDGEWMYRAVKIAVDKINEEGGLLGMPVELIVYDDAFQEVKVTSLYEKLCTEDNVDFLFGPLGSGLTLPAAGVAEKYDRILFGTITGAKVIHEQGYTNLAFPATPAKYYAIEGPFLALDFLANFDKWNEDPNEQKPETVAVLGANYAYGRENFERAPLLAKDMGYKVVYTELYDLALTDYSPILLRIRETKPDIVIQEGLYGDSLVFTKQLIEQKVYAKFLWTYGASIPGWTDPASGVGPRGNGICYTMYYPTKWRGGDADYLRAKYRELYNEETNLDHGFAYAAIELMAKAVNTAGSVDKSAVIKALHENEYETVLTNVKIQPNGANATERFIAAVAQQINNKREEIWPPEFQTHKPVYPYPPFT